jgi:hypothetical protein
MSRPAPLCIVPRVVDANGATCYHPRVRHRDPRHLFVGTYGRFADACREVDEPGLAAIAVDETTGALVGICGLRACPGRPSVAVLGRHDRCDLVMGGDDVALRHVAIVIDPVTSWAKGARAAYRMIDLRTTAGVLDETGRPLRAFRADGPAVLRCGGQTIFLLPLGDPSDWPASAKHAWAMLPQRVYLDECGSIGRPRRSSTSLIFRTPPPVLHTAGLVRDDLAGTLDLQQPGRRSFVTVGRAALRDGVMFGRYGRCDLVGGEDSSVSRVHALVLEMSQQVMIIDLASTHGLGLAGGGRARVVELGDQTELWLATATRVRWCAAGRTEERRHLSPGKHHAVDGGHETSGDRGGTPGALPVARPGDAKE